MWVSCHIIFLFTLLGVEKNCQIHGSYVLFFVESTGFVSFSINRLLEKTMLIKKFWKKNWKQKIKNKFWKKLKKKFWKKLIKKILEKIEKKILEKIEKKILEKIILIKEFCKKNIKKKNLKQKFKK